MKLKERVLVPDCHCTFIRKPKSKWPMKQRLSARRVSAVKGSQLWRQGLCWRNRRLICSVKNLKKLAWSWTWVTWRGEVNSKIMREMWTWRLVVTGKAGEGTAARPVCCAWCGQWDLLFPGCLDVAVSSEIKTPTLRERFLRHKPLKWGVEQ